MLLFKPPCNSVILLSPRIFKFDPFAFVNAAFISSVIPFLLIDISSIAAFIDFSLSSKFTGSIFPVSVFILSKVVNNLSVLIFLFNVEALEKFKNVKFRS